ncbi:MAG: hypothetical protein H6748_19345 [Spirochaetaceae bacterium]|nr:hypothetical protein [Myxococcales bacterium]MCB9726212.1 hypothetical protein [Spirochaetaceae bacterium]
MAGAVRVPTSEGIERSAQEDGGTGLGLVSPHFLVGVTCFALLGAGPLWIDSLDMSPRNGVGYALGIVGLGAMTLLLGYSLRKRVRLLRRVGPIRSWLEAHLMLGLIGPTAIVYHSNFDLKSMNATVSMLAMLAVAGSGVGGRFLYGRMYRSLAGSRRTVGSYIRDAQGKLEPLSRALDHVPEARALIDAFTASVVARPPLPLLPVKALSMRPRAFLRRRAVVAALRRAAHPEPVPIWARDSLKQYFTLMRRAAQLTFFEQLFALWHAIHVPLTYLLFLSAIVHVVAVHLY